MASLRPGTSSLGEGQRRRPGSDSGPGVGVRVSSRELPLSGALALRLDPRNTAAMESAGRVFGAALPGPNAWLACETAQVLSQAYDEWLILTPNGRQDALAASLRHALADAHFAITDVSDLRAGFEVHGERARDLLQKGTAVDLHPRVFGAGACTTTALARVRVTIRATGAQAYELLVERSYAAYLWDWLTDASAEFT